VSDEARSEEEARAPGSAGELAEAGPQDVSLSVDTESPEARERVRELTHAIDPSDAHSILFFGAEAQKKLTAVSDQMLEGVKNKDLDEAGGMLSRLVDTVRGFDVSRLDPNRKPSWLERLLRRGRPLVRFLQRYEEVAGQVESIGDQLERHKTQLLTDMVSLDRLYDANLESFRSLELHIEAGRRRLRQLDEEEIPARQREAEASGDPVAAQALRDLRSARDDLDRRVHDLLLTRQVTMQALPAIRLVQQNDKGLVGRIESTLANTVPLWRQQLATAITLYRSGAAARTVRAANDLTNELLEANAEKLRSATGEARREIERGVFDIESVKRANDNLVATIEESLRIADEGRQRRAEAAARLEECEDTLRQTLAHAAANE